MIDALDRYTRISEGFDLRVRGVQQDQWDAATPCEEWDVRALVAHLVGTHHMILSTLGQTNEPADANGDLVGAWTAAREGVLAALRDEGSASQIVASPFGEMPFSGLAGGLLCGDTLFHTWDLARATGQDETLGDDLCSSQLEMMLPMDDFIRSPGFFGDKVEAPADADVQTRLLYFGGRRP